MENEAAVERFSGKPSEEAEAEGWLHRVAQDRDQQAYALFFERYQSLAFNLAMRILGNKAWAEEAVQESMLSVWRSAKTFRAGSPKSWIFSIVSHQSMHMARNRRRERKRMETLTAWQTETPRKGLETSLEREEQLSVLRRVLDALPLADRQLIALYHAGGLTHEEIGASLAMPRRTVTQKLQNALESLRAELVRAGMAAAGPVLSAEWLSEAICTGYEAPPGLREKVLAHIAQGGRDSFPAAVTHSHRGAAVKAPASMGLYWATGMVLLIGAGAVLWAPWTRPVAPSVQVTPASLPHPPAPPKNSLPARWTFEKGLPHDLQMVHNVAQWTEPGIDRPGAMVLPIGQVTAVLLPMSIQASQFKLQMKVRKASEGDLTIGFGRDDRNMALYKRVWPGKKGGETVTGLDRSIEWAFYYIDDYMIMTRAGKFLDRLTQYKKSEHEKIFYISGQNVAIEEIEISEFRADEQPEIRNEIQRMVSTLTPTPWLKLTPLRERSNDNLTPLPLIEQGTAPQE